MIDGIYIEGNNGGDYLQLNPVPKTNLVKIKVGHSCVATKEMTIPVEILTYLITRATWDGLEKVIDETNWPKDFRDKLKSQIEIGKY